MYSFFIQVFLTPTLFANQVPSKNEIAKVNQLVENKNFSEAIDIYRDWVALGFKSKWIFYNLGLLHEKVGDVGYAMYYLKKAEKAAPDDVLINNRIVFLQEKIKDKFYFLLYVFGYFPCIFYFLRCFICLGDLNFINLFFSFKLD